MNDEALIRLANLKALGLTATLLSEKVGGRYTYWRDLLAGEKSFGEKAARKIEEAMGYPRGFLDAVEDRQSTEWPFLQVTLKQLQGLPTEYIQALEKHALDLLSLAKTPIQKPLKHADTNPAGAPDYVMLSGKLPPKESTRGRPDTHTERGSTQRKKRL